MIRIIPAILFTHNKMLGLRKLVIFCAAMDLRISVPSTVKSVAENNAIRSSLENE